MGGKTDIRSSIGWLTRNRRATTGWARPKASFSSAVIGAMGCWRADDFCRAVRNVLVTALGVRTLADGLPATSKMKAHGMPIGYPVEIPKGS
jgi:hypothetical protein